MTLKIRNTRDLTRDPRSREPWPENFVEWNKPRDPKLLDELGRILDQAEDEKPLQDFYTQQSYLLAVAFAPHRCWIFPKPRFGGGKLIPDFLYCDRNSLGYAWTIIELESPLAAPTNKDGSVSKALHHAVEQIHDYRRWVRDYALFEDQQGLKGLNSDCEGLVVIGRREERTELERQRLAEFRKQKIDIASYDRLVNDAREHLAFINHHSTTTAKSRRSDRI